MSESPKQQAYSRRDMLRWSAALGVGVVGAPLLAACSRDDTVAGGSSASTSPSPPSGKLAEFDPGAAAGDKPDLPNVLAHANYITADFFNRVSYGLKKGCADFNLQYLEADAQGDVKKNVGQIQTFLQRGIGALGTHPLDPAAQADVLQQALNKGVCVLGNVLAPSTIQDVASQYDIGFRQGQAAAKYIEENLSGEAEVLNLNSDDIAALKPRSQGVRDALKKSAPGARIVVDTTPRDRSQDGAFKAGSTALQKNPEIKVVVGGDVFVLGAMAAFQAAGKKGDDLYFSGVDGEKQALKSIKQGGMYKASFAWPMETLAYAWSKFAADWLEGKSIPQVITLSVVELNSPSAVDEFTNRMADPKTTWENDAGLRPLLGNINFDSKDDYLKELYPV